MNIQPISAIVYCNKYNSVNCKKANLQTKSASFKGNYEQVLRDVLTKDLRTRADVEGAMSDLYFALVKESGVTKTPLYSTLSEWLAVKGTYLVEELCKPIADVRSDFRDIIFKSKEESQSIIEKGRDAQIYIMNFGKHGFWNSIFESEYAANDMRVIFSSRDGSFEVATNSKGKLVSEQYWRSGYWKKNTYNMFLGDRIAQKTGDASETVIWPGI